LEEGAAGAGDRRDGPEVVPGCIVFLSAAADFGFESPGTLFASCFPSTWFHP